MLSLPVILLIVAGALVLYLITFYNRLKTLQVQIGASIQEIGNQLKRQADLIPNLVESAKSYLKHEKDIFTLLADARKSIDSAVKKGSAKELDTAQSKVNQVLEGLRVVVESNPQLASAGIVSDLMGELRDTSDKIMYARRTLIDLSADFNQSIVTIPGVWFASLLGFTKQESGLATPTSGEHLEVSDTDIKTPKVTL